MTKKILYIQYTDPTYYPPLEYSSTIFADEGWMVKFAGIKVFGSDSLEFPHHPNIRVRYINFYKTYFKHALDYLRYFSWALLRIIVFRPHWVYASDILSCPVAFIVSFFPKIKIIYHEHDTPPYEAGDIFSKLCFKMRELLGKRADICILPNEKRLQNYLNTVARTGKSFLVWNCPMRKGIRTPRMDYRKEKWTLHYHGSISPDRLPITIVEAFARLPDSIIFRIIGYETIGSRGYIDYIMKEARRLNISHRIEFLGSMNRKELYDVCCLGDVGMACLSKAFPNVNETAGASNKPFEYLACGLALLVSDLPGWRKMYVDKGYGIACNLDKAEEIVSALRWFLDHPEQRIEMARRGRQRIMEDWNYEEQFKPVIRYISSKNAYTL